MHSIGLGDQDVRRHGLACVHGGAWRPQIVRYRVRGNGASRAKTDLDAVLSRSGSGADAGDDIVVHGHKRSGLVGSDSVFLKIVDGRVVNFDLGDATPAALDKNARAALATSESRA